MSWIFGEEKKPIDRSGPEYNYYRELENLNKEAKKQNIEYKEKIDNKGLSYFDEAGLKNYKLSKVDLSKITNNTTKYFYLIPPFGREMKETIAKTYKTHTIPGNGEWVEFTKVSDSSARLRFFDENLEHTDYGELQGKEVTRSYIYEKPTWMGYLGKKKDAAMLKFCENYIKGKGGSKTTKKSRKQRKSKTTKKRKSRRRG